MDSHFAFFPISKVWVLGPKLHCSVQNMRSSIECPYPLGILLSLYMHFRWILFRTNRTKRYMTLWCTTQAIKTCWPHMFVALKWDIETYRPEPVEYCHQTKQKEWHANLRKMAKCYVCQEAERCHICPLPRKYLDCPSTQQRLELYTHSTSLYRYALLIFDPVN